MLSPLRWYGVAAGWNLGLESSGGSAEMLGQLGHSPPHVVLPRGLQKDSQAYGAVQAPRERSKSGECRVPDAGEAEPRTGAAFSAAPLSQFRTSQDRRSGALRLSVVKTLWPF